jgi:hypothetical protein
MESMVMIISEISVTFRQNCCLEDALMQWFRNMWMGPLFFWNNGKCCVILVLFPTSSLSLLLRVSSIFPSIFCLSYTGGAKWRTNYLRTTLSRMLKLMYMKKIWKKCFRQKNQFFLLLLLTVIQCKQRYIRTLLPCNVIVNSLYLLNAH